MQLKPGGIAAAIGLFAAGLLGASEACAQDSPADPGGAAPAARASNAYDATASEPGTFTADSAVLYYQEDDGRVRAIEAETGIAWNGSDGSGLSLRYTFDSLTGATPNGAIRSVNEQRFQPPAQPARPTGHLGTIDGGTGASGTYTVQPGLLPVDTGFKDHRHAIDLGATIPAASGLKLAVGGAMSVETDYTSYSSRATLSKELDRKNTTLSLGVNYEYDRIRPYSGVPQELGDMGSDAAGSLRIKRVFNVVAGVTQVLTPQWLVQLNYSFGRSNGYHTDPYKLVSLVDSTSGDPFFSIYEKRPDQRTRHSVYLGSKLALGSFVTDASARHYTDSWGIKALTFALSEHVPVGRSSYVEPVVRWYHQTAADFFRHFVYLDEPTPETVSADSRLSRFGAWTLGLRGGVHLTDTVELYGSGERYWQYGLHFDRTLPGNLATTDLFAGSRSFSLVAGLRLTFH